MPMEGQGRNNLERSSKDPTQLATRKGKVEDMEDWYLRVVIQLPYPLLLVATGVATIDHCFKLW